MFESSLIGVIYGTVAALAVWGPIPNWARWTVIVIAGMAWKVSGVM